VELCHDATIAESRLWHHLRGSKLGVKVRRQHPIGRFIVDFYAAKRRLVIEVDGSVHDQQTERDTERSTILEAQGYRIVRFTNEQVLHEIETVLAQLRDMLAPEGPPA
jgi:very-short-patch-repair endonuclease